MKSELLRFYIPFYLSCSVLWLSGAYFRVGADFYPNLYAMYFFMLGMSLYFLVVRFGIFHVISFLGLDCDRKSLLFVAAVSIMPVFLDAASLILFSSSWSTYVAYCYGGVLFISGLFQITKASCPWFAASTGAVSFCMCSYVFLWSFPLRLPAYIWQYSVDQEFTASPESVEQEFREDLVARCAGSFTARPDTAACAELNSNEMSVATHKLNANTRSLQTLSNAQQMMHESTMNMIDNLRTGPTHYEYEYIYE